MESMLIAIAFLVAALFFVVAENCMLRARVDALKTPLSETKMMVLFNGEPIFETKFEAIALANSEYGEDAADLSLTTNEGKDWLEFWFFPKLDKKES